MENMRQQEQDLGRNLPELWSARFRMRRRKGTISEVGHAMLRQLLENVQELDRSDSTLKHRSDYPILNRCEE